MRRLLNGVYVGCGWLGALCILGICVVMVGQSLMRAVGLPTGGANDLVAWLCAAGAFLPMAYTFKHGDFVRVGLLIDRIGAGPRRVLELAALGVACAGIGYLAWWASVFAFESWQFNEMGTGMLAWPLWVPQLGFVIGASVFLIAVVDEAIIVLRGQLPTYVAAVQERHARGDYSSDI